MSRQQQGKHSLNSSSSNTSQQQQGSSTTQDSGIVKSQMSATSTATSRMQALSIGGGGNSTTGSASSISSVGETQSMRNQTASSLPIENQTSQKTNVSLDASEFISFAMYRLWHPRAVERRRTVSIGLANREAAALAAQRMAALAAANNNYNGNSNDSIHLSSSNSQTSSTFSTLTTPGLSNIVSPDGTQLWYPMFVHRIHKLLRAASLPTPFIFMALLYIARLRQFIPQIEPSDDDNDPNHPSVNEATGKDEYSLFLAALMTSQKQNSDSRYANKAWARIAEIPLEAVNSVESEFLMGMRWSLHIRDDQYKQWVVAMQTLGKEHALVLRAFAMEERELAKLEVQLAGRPDLLLEIKNLRRAKTFN